LKLQTLERLDGVSPHPTSSGVAVVVSVVVKKLGVLCALCGEGACAELTTEDAGNTEGGRERHYNDGSDGSEGGQGLPGVAVVAAVVVENALCPLCSLW
jgi:hypothetical protein